MSFLSLWNRVNTLGGYILGSRGGTKRQVILSAGEEKFTLPVRIGKNENARTFFFCKRIDITLCAEQMMLRLFQRNHKNQSAKIK